LRDKICSHKGTKTRRCLCVLVMASIPENVSEN
jgi:hypothetical protein